MTEGSADTVLLRASVELRANAPCDECSFFPGEPLLEEPLYFSDRVSLGIDVAEPSSHSVHVGFP